MKHKFIAKRYWKDQSTAMGQSDVMAKSFDDVINLSLGDPDLITDDIIIEGAFKDAKAGHTKYTDFRGDPELREEICRFYKDEYGMDVKTLSAVVGHRSSSTTLNVYTHVTKAMERQAAAKIDQGIGKQEAPKEEALETK